MTFIRFVIVAGLSGAGTSQAIKALEDVGFTCADRLPPALASEFVTLAEEAVVERLAIALEGRIGGPFGSVGDALDALDRRGVAYDLLFLEATDETLVRRYSETRRRHPSDDGSSLEAAIGRERVALEPLRERATLVLDTSAFTLGALKASIVAAYATEPSSSRLAVGITAFGYKFGVPRDADLVFDVRFLPNPNYVPELKGLTGRDAAVAAFMEAIPETAPFLERLFGMIDFLLPLYLAEGKSRLGIAIGCTGGRHRSVYVAERLASHLRDRSTANVTIDGRELAAR